MARTPKIVATIAELRALVNHQDRDYAVVGIGTNTYWYVAASMSPDDGDLVIRPTNVVVPGGATPDNPGRWHKLQADAEDLDKLDVNAGLVDIAGTDAGTTTDAYVEIISAINVSGLWGCGTIKNTHVGNSLTIRETYVDAFGDGGNIETVLPAGDPPYELDPMVEAGAYFPPFTVYAVSVKSTSGGDHATFKVHFASNGQ
jgi:hypothetical protein